MPCESNVAVTHIHAVWTSANTDDTWHGASGATGMSQFVGVKENYMPAHLIRFVYMNKMSK